MAGQEGVDGANGANDGGAEQGRQEGRKPEVAGEEGMAAIAVMEAIVRSAESGAPVEVGSL